MGRDEIKDKLEINGGKGGVIETFNPVSFFEKEIRIRDSYGLCFEKKHLGVIQQNLREQLLSSYLGGITTDQAEAGIRSALRDYVTLTREQASTIARTVLGGANCYRRYLDIKKSGFKRKEWFTANDKDVRPLHREMHGKIIGTGDLWVFSDGNTLRFPGDPEGPDHLVVNCRCIEVVDETSHWAFEEDDEE